MVNMSLYFKNLFLILFLLCAQPLLSQSPPRIVATFHSFGIYWSPANGSADIKCHVNYRKVNSAVWRPAQDLWFDERGLDGRQPEYRGSIVNLDPGQDYAVQLWLEDGFRTEIVLNAATWNETFPISKVVEFPNLVTQTVTIDESGSELGYVLYTSRAGQEAILDVERNEIFNILIAENVHHVILRGLTLRNSARHGIRISDYCHDIIIEDCDISGWGDTDSTGYGINLNAAISAAYRSDNIERLVIQNNRIHHPFGNANSWGEPRPKDGDKPTAAHLAVFSDTSDPDYQTLLKSIQDTKAKLDAIKRFDMPGFKPRPEYVREMKRYGVLPASFDLAKDPIDVYETDRKYWRSLWCPANRPQGVMDAP